MAEGRCEVSVPIRKQGWGAVGEMVGWSLRRVGAMAPKGAEWVGGLGGRV